MTASVHFDFDDQAIVVTGGAQGIGAACVERLVRSRARVALWDVDADRGSALAEQLDGSAERCCFISCDVSRPDEVDAAVEASVRAFGTIDGLVNNAGIVRSAPFLQMAADDWQQVLDVNLGGAFRVGQAIARVMAERGHGVIVNMGSVSGLLASPDIAAYNVSKGGMHQLTRVMAVALAGSGIRVNAVAPGTIATDLAIKAVMGNEQARRMVLGRTPLGRLGEPAEVAQAVAFLLSPAASYMTGSIMTIDGGRLALNYSVASS
jgi:NAD(P)-dependent dehydrogenase (short-subunit alcohol dehydrogenase family)